MSSSLNEPVFIAKTTRLRRAAQYLQSHGIGCRHTRPKRSEGILRVAAADAPRARALLAAHFDEGLLSATEAAYFSCPSCDATLSLGQKWCSECGEFVGDPHAG